MASEALLREKIQWQNVTPGWNRTWASHSLWFQIQHYPFYTNLAFACKTETLSSLYVLSLSSRRPLSSERRGPGSIPEGGGNSQDFLFSRSKASATNIDIIANFGHFEKTVLSIAWLASQIRSVAPGGGARDVRPLSV